MNCKSLPKGYRYAGNLDFTRNRKQIKVVLIIAIALTVAPLVIGLIVSPPVFSLKGIFGNWPMWIAAAAMLVAYIPLHELTHGIVMYALSGVKPSYGLKLPYAYCGSNVWFDRREHILTALAPLVFWGVALQILIVLLPPEWFWPLWATQISNLSGSAGDIYCAWALWRMPGQLLIQDTGTRMRVMRLIE